ncbi:head GIN domain-containing protein [Aquimarina sp. W85]|uniref:head GIN domain-containing protein n=1 Tax=Aquimarina rhodophyticola TaxID=3342246 RepID=UPI00366B6B32
MGVSRNNIKHIICILLILGIISGCDTENAPDCFQRTGTIVKKEFFLDNFTKLLVGPNIEVILKQGDTTKVILETGENLINEVSAIVRDSQLVLENNNDCNFVRDFNQTKVFITIANLTVIRSATQFPIRSEGVLDFDNLTLLSEDVGFAEGNTTGIFDLTLNSNKLNIVGNNIASFIIKGAVSNLSVGLYSGTGRFDGERLNADHVSVYHRGANKILVNPQLSLKGEIRSTGDVISVNKPREVFVKEFYTGRLIFR